MRFISRPAGRIAIRDGLFRKLASFTLGCLVLAAPAFGQTMYSVSDPATLGTTINIAASGDTILFSNDLKLPASLPFITKSLTIDGQGTTLDANQFRAFTVLTGTLTLKNVTIKNAKVQGFTGGDSVQTTHGAGGGGAGLGGAVFVGTGATVSVSNVSLLTNNASGGIGGNGGPVSGTGIGGGGSSGGGGGGVGVQSIGSTGGFGGGGGGGDGATGGAGYDGGMGGFGGGGGSGGSGTNAVDAGLGGFGGGSSGLRFAAPPIPGGGGGGAGLGGALFVQEGGTLTFSGTLTVNGNTVTGGPRALDAANQPSGGPGSAFGSGVFLQGSSSIVFQPANGVTQTISDDIADQTGSGGTGGNAGAGALVKNGAGTLVLGGTNTYTGGTSINAGTLVLSGSYSGQTSLNSGMLLVTGSYGGGGITSANGVVQFGNGGALANIAVPVASDGLLDFDAANTFTYSGVFSGIGTAVKDGSGTTILSGDNTYSGQTTVVAGTLRITHAHGLGSTAGGTQVTGGAIPGTLEIAGVSVGDEALALDGVLLGTDTAALSGAVTLGASATIGGAGTLTLSGVLSAGGFTKTGAGTLVLTGTNTYTGNTVITGGLVEFGVPANFGTGTITLNGGGLRWATGTSVDFSSSAQLVRVIGPNGTTFDTNGNNVALAGNFSGAGAVTKIGAGTLALNGTGQYGGATTVSAGTLLVNNTFDGSAGVFVQHGATLGGTGEIGGSVIGDVGGIYAPGSGGLGTLSVDGDFTWAGIANPEGSATMLFDLSGSDATSDRLAIGSNFKKGAGDYFIFDFKGTGHGTTASPTVYTLATFAGTTFTVDDFRYVNLAPGLGGAFSIGGGQLQFTVADRFLVNSDTSLREAIFHANVGGATKIVFTSNITLTTSLPMMSADFTVDGGGFTLDGNNVARAFFVESGNATISNVSITRAVARGGNGGFLPAAGAGGGGGGGGLGAGAAIFVYTGGSATLTNVQVLDALAAGGDGGIGGSGGMLFGANTYAVASAGGGGLGGNGGNTFGNDTGSGGGGGYMGKGGNGAYGGSGGGGGEFGKGGAGNSTFGMNYGGNGGGGGQRGNGGNGAFAAGGGGGGLLANGATPTVLYMGVAGGGAEGGAGSGFGLQTQSARLPGGGGGGNSVGGGGDFQAGHGARSGGGGGAGTGEDQLGGDGGIGGGGGGGYGGINAGTVILAGRGGDGGPFGGGGGLAGVTNPQHLVRGGNGGYGGGGGGDRPDADTGKLLVAPQGGAGGFGGGGGGGYVPGVGGAYGGHGSSVSLASFGTGGPTAAHAHGGGGAGLGGAVFVATGGTLTVNDCSLNGTYSAAGGNVPHFEPTEATVGQGVGAAVFVHGTGVMNINVSNGTTQTIVPGELRSYGNYPGVITVLGHDSMAGDGGFTKGGTGTLILPGPNSFSGSTTVNAGLLQAGGPSAFGTSSFFTVAANATLDLNSFDYTLGSLAGAGSVTQGTANLAIGSNNSDSAFSGIISGSGTLTKVGTGTLTLTGANTYTGATTVNGGLIGFNALTSFGPAALTLDGGGLQWTPGNTLDISARVSPIGAGGAAFDTNGNDITFATVLSGSGGLTKIGAGTLTLPTDENYVGPTTVGGGTLLVTGSTRSSSAVTVQGGGTLAGTGVVKNDASTEPGGHVAPSSGGGIGTLTLLSQFTWSGSADGSATMFFGLGDKGLSSQLLIAGSLLKAGALGSTYAFDFQGTGFDAGAGTTYALMTFLGTQFNASDFTYVNLAPGFSGEFSIVDVPAGKELHFDVRAIMPVTDLRFTKGEQVVGEAAGIVYGAFNPPQVGVFAGTAKHGKQKTRSLFTNDGSVLLQVGDSVPGLTDSVITGLGFPSGDAVLAILKAGKGGILAGQNVVLLTGLESGTPTAVAQTGVTLPGLPAGVTIKKFLTIDGQGPDVLFLAQLQGTGVTPANSLALGAIPAAGGNVNLLVRKGDTVNAKSVSTIATLVGSPGTLAQGRWRKLEDDNVGSAIGVRLTFAEDKSQTIYEMPANATGQSDWTERAATANITTIPDLAGDTALKFGLPGFGPDRFATLVKLSGSVTPASNVALVTGADSGAPSLLVQKGDTLAADANGNALTGATVTGLSDPVVGADDRVAFLLSVGLKPGVNKPGIGYSTDGTNWALLANAGANAPGGGHWASFSSLILTKGTLGGPAFVGKLAIKPGTGVTEKNNLGLWGVDAFGNLQLLLRTGQSINGKTIKSFTALEASPGSIGAANGYQNDGNIAVAATFTDGTQALLQVVP